MNRSLDAATAEFLRLFNAANGPETPGRGQLIQALEAVSDGPPICLPPEEAALVADRFAECNAWLAQRLLGRDTLFEETPPSAGSLPALDTAGAVRIATRKPTSANAPVTTPIHVSISAR